jgi:hypothetical protein
MTPKKRLNLLFEELKVVSGIDNLWIDYDKYYGYSLISVNKDNGGHSDCFGLGFRRFTIKEITILIEGLLLGIEFQKQKDVRHAQTQEQKLVCCICGSDSVIVQVWADPNTGIVDNINEYDRSICLNCQANVELEIRD